MHEKFPLTPANVRDLLQRADEARSLTFEVRNLIVLGNQQLRDEQKDFGPHIPLYVGDLMRAGEAVEKAAEQACKEQALIHRNLMTLFGYIEAAKDPVLVPSREDLIGQACELMAATADNPKLDFHATREANGYPDQAAALVDAGWRPPS